MWELDHKRSLSTEELMLLNCVLEKTLESPLDWKIQLVHPKGNQPWIFIGRTDAEAESSVPYHMMQIQLTGKDPDAGKDWKQEEKGMTEDETVQWHHQLSGHEFEQALGDAEGQTSLLCFSPWDCEESDMPWRLKNNKGFRCISL